MISYLDRWFQSSPIAGASKKVPSNGAFFVGVNRTLELLSFYG